MPTHRLIPLCVLLLPLLLPGCQNTCQRAAQHYLECFEAHCQEHDDPACPVRLTDPVIAALADAQSCPIEERAQALLDASCAEIITGEISDY